jgi:hypothetical protein
MPRWKVLAFSLAPLLALLVAAEVVARLVRDPFRLGSYRQLRLDMARRGYPVQPDPLLGYTLKPVADPLDNRWGTRVTTTPEGFRRNGAGPAPPPRPDGPVQGPILAVGDSFTFGDQVSDHETWPAYLESMLQVPVHNAGVFGYSLGQAVLRAEQILERSHHRWLIVSFVPDDISRCEYSRRYGPKPYFDIVDGELALNLPGSPRDVSPGDQRARRLKNRLGHSALLDAVLGNTFEEWWYKEERYLRVHPEGTGLRIARLLVDRLAGLSREQDVRILLVAQGQEISGAADTLLAHARARELPTLDLIAGVHRLAADDPGILDRYFFGHMTPEGNRWVAGEIARLLSSESR